jgi:hypothetical protein
VKGILLLLAVSFWGPVVLSVTEFLPRIIAVPELAPWTLMLLGFAGTAVSLRAGRWRARARRRRVRLLSG